MLIKINKIGFKERFFRRVLNGLWFFVLIFLCGFFITGLYVFLLTSMLSILLNIYISNKESNVYIEKIEINEHTIGIGYFVKNDPIRYLELKLENLEIEWFGNGIGFSSIFTPKLVFKKNAQVVLVQYSVGEWDEEKMREIEKFFHKFKNGTHL